MAAGAVKQVSVMRCSDYDRERVFEAVKRSVDLLGGIGAFVASNSRVLVKPNLLQGAAPERCVTTHPSVVRAVARLLLEHGCRVIIADSPGGGIVYTEIALNKAYRVSGFDAISAELGIALNFDCTFSRVMCPDGIAMKQFSLITPALECDAVVVVSKAKMHVWTLQSGAAKNLFGLIPGLEKPVCHSRFPESDGFAQMIIDLNELVKPRLQVMDVVVGMEGDGPLSGRPRVIGAVLASGSYSALDAVLARLMAIDPMDVATIRHAAGRGLIAPDLSDILTVGDPIEPLIVADFQKPATYLGQGRGVWHNVAHCLVSRLGKVYALYPTVDAERCVRCGKCHRICPMKAITMGERAAAIDLSRCIRCYCCHEMCTDSAIGLRRSIADRILQAIMG